MVISVFPVNPVDGLKTTDSAGQAIVYDSESNAWVLSAADTQSELVDTSQNGIIAPEMVDLLAQITQASGLKILPNVYAYWYLLGSRHYVNFRVSGNTIIPEINSGALIRALSGYACPGIKGDKGSTGALGHDSTEAGPNEVFYVAEMETSGNVIINVEVPIPIKTNISTRIYDLSENLLVEIISDLNGNVISISDNIIGVEIISISYNKTSKLLLMEIFGEWPGDIKYKSRQIGPTGDAGVDGAAFIIIHDNIISDADAIAQIAITTMRANKRNGLLYSKINVDTALFSVSSLNPQFSNFASFPSIISTLDSQNPNMWVAIEPTIDDRKTIYRWGFNGCTDCDPPLLDLPVWVPYGACHHHQGGGTTFDNSSFKWWENTTEKNPPFTLVLGVSEATQCQEDMFYCNKDVDNCPNDGSPYPLIS